MDKTSINHNKKPYSWAGHCRFEVVEDASFAGEDDDEWHSQYEDDEFDSQSNDYEDESKTPEYIREYPSDIKSKKPSQNITNSSPKYQINLVKPIKEVYVYLRNDTVLKKLQIKKPKYVHLYSHPLKKVSSAAARKLKSLKNMKLLTFRDYGYNIGEPVEYEAWDADREEAQNGFLSSEDVLTLKELGCLLAGRVSLRKLYVMLFCEDWKTFKKLQVYARRQKNLQEFGFISDFSKSVNKKKFCHSKCDLSPLRLKLEKLEIRLDEKSKVKIRGLEKLSRLTSFNTGTTCGLFPCDNPDYGYGDDPYSSFEGVMFCSEHLKQISQVVLNKKVQSICLKTFEVGFDRDFWRKFFQILETRTHIKLTFEILSDSNSAAMNFIDEIKDEIEEQDFEGSLQILILDSGMLGEYCFHGSGLRTDKFNFDKQYLFEIPVRNYEKRKVVSLLAEDSPRSSDSSDVFGDIAYIGYQPGLH